ncbi:hypothetical protein F2P81_010962 [Scophthalmus maximus]|uniref:Phosphoribosyltransferase domain-containing protein n=1 Tax=Scophthalmus maximus TaxID=52904 RepID=A0A6A4SUS2_SCOMX|nr:hypothetical protein F2P81_010962 [Scophthalmus maximus]
MQRELSVRALLASAQQTHALPQTLSVLASSPQVGGLHTIIRYFSQKVNQNKNNQHPEAPVASADVSDDVSDDGSDDVSDDVSDHITGVSVLRAGETMEPALRAVCKDVRIGKIFIQTNLDSGEPELHYLRLPKDISEDHVIVMDSTVSTGAAAMMAVRVLLVGQIHNS